MPAALLLVLVLESDRDDNPPIIELKDILLNEPEPRAFISGAFKAACCEFVRSRALRISCDAWLSSSWRDGLGEEGVSKRELDQRLGVEGLDTGGESNVPAREMGKATAEVGVGSVDGVVIDSSLPSCGGSRSGMMMSFTLEPLLPPGGPSLLLGLPPLLPGLPLLLPGLEMYFAVQLRLLDGVSVTLMCRKRKMEESRTIRSLPAELVSGPLKVRQGSDDESVSHYHRCSWHKVYVHYSYFEYVPREYESASDECRGLEEEAAAI